MKKINLLLLVVFLFGCNTKYAENKADSFPVLTDKYLGQIEPKLSPKIFAPNIVSTGMSEINACFSPDYKEFLYSIVLPDSRFVIMSMEYSDGKWSEPEVASFSGKYSSADPFITLDGRWLYFVSKRPFDTLQDARNDWDIWRLEKIDGKWSNIERLDSNVNSDADDIYPSLSNQGTLYFSSGRNGNNNRDIYIAKSKDNGFEPSVRLSDTINSHWEGDVYISPDEDYMIFRSYGRQEGSGLYISFKTNKRWDFPVRMDEDINMNGHEFCPIVSPDGQFFFFTSNHTTSAKESSDNLSYSKIKNDFNNAYFNPGMGKNDIYWVDIGILEKYK